jgi:DNA polymerase-1
MQATGNDPLTSRVRLVVLALSNRRVYVADIFDLGQIALHDLALLLEDSHVKKVIHDAKTALSFIRTSQGRKLKFKNIFDTMLASQLCWSGFYDLEPSNSPKNPWKKLIPDHSLEALAERHLGIILNKDPAYDWNAQDLTAEQIHNAAMHTFVLLPIHSVLQGLIDRNGLYRVADLEFRTISVVVEMELSGIYLDAGAARKVIMEKEARLVEAFLDIQEEAQKNGFVPVSHGGKETSKYLNPDSQEEVKRYLQSHCFNITSTRAEVLRDLALGGNIFADRLLTYRQISHQLAFLNSWLKHIHPSDGRIHPQYFQLQSATGRLSSRKPNAQQIPRRGEDAPAIRKLFKAPPGKKLVKADFSAIELRIVAYLSGDQTMLEAFLEKQDLHKMTACKISGLSLDQVTEDDRQAAKCINYLLIYGGSAQTLQQRSYYDYGVIMSLDEAEEARNKYFEHYSGVGDWQERQIMNMSCTYPHYFHNCVRGTFYLPLSCTFTALGRRRVWPRFGEGIKATKFQAFNTPCQGTGADLIKMVMCELYDSLRSEDVKIIGSIHDEILLEVPEDQAEEHAKMLGAIMDRVGSKLLYPVPVTSEAEILSSWGG